MKKLMLGVLLGVVGVFAFQALFVSLFLAVNDQTPLLLNPDHNLSEDGIAMAMLCSEDGLTPKGRHSEILENMPPDGNWGAWSRGRAVRGNCDIWYHHGPLYNPHAIETCWIGCDHDLLERLLR
jgi:hypothetical protein